jgi:hypothetical protein
MLTSINCPNCNCQLIKGIKQYYCPNINDCQFFFPVAISNRKIDEEELCILINNKRLECNGFASKAGRLFSAVILLKNNLGKYKLDWPGINKSNLK